MGSRPRDLPGYFSAGETLNQAIENTYEAIDVHVELLIESVHRYRFGPAEKGNQTTMFISAARSK